MESIKQMSETEVCEHCGHQLKTASLERKQISEDLIERHDTLDVNLKNREDKIDQHLKEREEKLDATLEAREKKLDTASSEMLAMIQRMERRLGADLESREAIRLLEEKIRAKIAVEDRRIGWLDNRWNRDDFKEK